MHVKDRLSSYLAALPGIREEYAWRSALASTLAVGVHERCVGPLLSVIDALLAEHTPDHTARLRAAYQAGWNAAVLHLQGQNLTLLHTFTQEQIAVGIRLAEQAFPEPEAREASADSGPDTA